MPLFSIDTHGQLEPALSNEWLLTNGIGGFACSTLAMCNRRRYHGWLVGATLPPVGRIMALSHLAETLILDSREDQPIELAIHQFGDLLHPRGDRYLEHFELHDADARSSAAATWSYRAQDVSLTREMRLLDNKNLLAVTYSISAPANRKVELRLAPFVGLRDFHALLHHGWATFDVAGGGEQIAITNAPHTLHLRSPAGRFHHHPDWWFRNTYAFETERGQDDTEDLFTPGHFTHDLSGTASFTFLASLNDPLPETPILPAPRTIVSAAPAGSSLTMQRLHHAASDFLVQRRRPDATSGVTIIAGYPWFSDWGRDTMISLPGLMLSTGRLAEAADTLRVFAHYVSEGMIPNHFDDYSNDPHYNTVDASLWFIHAAYEYLAASNDRQTFDSHLLPACREILRGYRDGTRFNIHMDPFDKLISAGDENTQLTWMDAKYQGVAFTPRQGKAVEINALWYNALCLMGERGLADSVRNSFQKSFWINDFRGLADVIDKGRRDTSLRPNQIFAASLPHSPLSQPQRLAVVEVVRRELLTPVGLRTLAPSDPNYHPIYTGPQSQRDRAYHNGTVWAWLIGPFLEAHLAAHDNTPAAQAQAREWLTPLIDHLNSACIGQISEVFDADPPHRPGGCFAQAWSIASVLRVAKMLGM